MQPLQGWRRGGNDGEVGLGGGVRDLHCDVTLAKIKWSVSDRFRVELTVWKGYGEEHISASVLLWIFATSLPMPPFFTR